MLNYNPLNEKEIELLTKFLHFVNNSINKKTVYYSSIFDEKIKMFFHGKLFFHSSFLPNSYEGYHNIDYYNGIFNEIATLKIEWLISQDNLEQKNRISLAKYFLSSELNIKVLNYLIDNNIKTIKIPQIYY